MSEDWGTLTGMAESAARGGRYDEAKDCYRRAMADADARTDAHNAYYTRCSLAGLLRLLDDYAEAERLLKEATKLRHDFPAQLAREPISPLTDLERILVKQNRLPELEQILYADTEKMHAVFGRDSFEFKMSLMNLAKGYGTHFKDMDKCKTYFREVLDWSKSAEPITRKMVYTSYDGILRAAGLTADADAAQQELEALKSQSQS
jgi:tetratricopeptide (TPR) repeat protein